MRKAKVWIAADVSDTLVSCLPKNGSSSFRTPDPTVKGSRRIYRGDIENYTHKIGIIRHPIARIHSIYKFLKGHRAKGLLTLNGVPVETYELFINHTFNHDNVHWNEQYSQLSDDEGVYIPTVTHRFEDLSQWWDLYFNNEIPHLNKSSSYEVNDYREVELLTKYHRDLTLWTISEMRNEGKRL